MDEELMRKLSEELLHDTFLALSQLPEKVRELDKEVSALAERVQAQRERLDRTDEALDKVEKSLTDRFNAAVQTRQEWSRAQFAAVAGLVTGFGAVAIALILKAAGVHL